jgi:Na+-translocating ferredoxin:NAD+ oxidoreductase subunit C
LQQHKGRASVPIVKVGQEVVRGEPIAVADHFVSVPMHAPATGVIRAIGLAPTAEGPKTQAIFLKVYHAASQQVLYGSECEPEHMNVKDIIQAVQDAGLVGLGGGAFPSHVKMQPPAGRVIHTLIVNGCECEPYLTCDHRLMLEYPADLMIGARLAMRAIGAERAIIGVEDNKLDAVSHLRARIPEASADHGARRSRPNIPQGAEKMLITALLEYRGSGRANCRRMSRVVCSTSVPWRRWASWCRRDTASSSAWSRSAGRRSRIRATSWVPIGTPVRFLLDQVGAQADRWGR